MQNPEHSGPEHSEYSPSPREADRMQRRVELEGDWDDAKRREAVGLNRLDKENEPFSYADSLKYLGEYEKAFIGKALSEEKDPEKRKEWEKTAEDVRLDLSLARVKSTPPMQRLIRGVENHLEILARQEEAGENTPKSEMRREDIRNLRRVRDTLFTHYDEIPKDGPIPTLIKFEITHRNQQGGGEAGSSSEESENEKPKIGDVLARTDEVLESTGVSERYDEISQAAGEVPAEITSKMTDELLELLNYHVAGGNSREAFAQAVSDLLDWYEQEVIPQEADMPENGQAA